MEAESGISLWGMLGVVAAIVSALYAALGFHYPTVKAELAEDRDYRREKAKALKHPAAWRLYGEYLARGLGWLEQYMGKPWSARAFGVCFVLALAYSLLFLLAAWAFFGGPGSVGATVLLPDLPPLWRVAVAAVLVAYAGGVWWIFRNVHQLDAWFVERLNGLTHRVRPDVSPAVGVWLYRGFCALLAGSVVAAALHSQGGTPLAGTWGSPAAVGLIMAVALAITGSAAAATVAIAIAMAFAALGAGAAAVATIIAGVGGGGGGERGTVLGAVAIAMFLLFLVGAGFSDPRFVYVILFLLILPFLNAWWDWLSWWISRALGEDQLASIRGGASWWRKLWTAAWHMAADLMAAVALLVALAFTLPLAADGYNILASRLGTEPPLVLHNFLCEAARRPWSDGLWATLMLLSTLLPTALHLGAVLASPSVFLFLPRERWHAVALELEQDNPPPRALRAAARHFAVVRPLTYAAAFTVACLLLYGLWRLFHLAEPVRLLLLTVATRDVAFARSCLADAGGIGG